MGGMVSNGFFGFVLLSYFSVSSHNIPLDFCDNIDRLFYDFNSFIGPLDRDAILRIATHIDMSTINS